MKKNLWVIALIFLSVGCSGEKLTVYEPETTPVSALEYDGGFQLFVEKEVDLALYEPEKGCLTGAYILSDKSVGKSIEIFESLTGKEHGLYTYFMKMGQPFPSDWALECISEMKTLNIVLAPENYDDPYNTKYLEETAKKFGEFYVPVFVHLYPVSEAYGQDPDGYRAFYKIARAYFKEYASNAAFVWSIDMDSLALTESFYPGDEYVDWVGINIYVNSYDENSANIEGAMAALDYFYYTFQERKPVFISQLGISHFSAGDHAYTVNQAQSAMEKLYREIEEKYPRIKAVNYMSYNGLEPGSMKGGNYNYSIADNGKMTNIYASCVKGEYFLKGLDFSGQGETFSLKVKYPFEIFYGEGEFFLEYEHVNTLLDNAAAMGVRVIPSGDKEFCALSEVYYEGYLINGDFNKRALYVLKSGRD